MPRRPLRSSLQVSCGVHPVSRPNQSDCRTRLIAAPVVGRCSGTRAAERVSRQLLLGRACKINKIKGEDRKDRLDRKWRVEGTQGIR
jgi:hypothetical protein